MIEIIGYLILAFGSVCGIGNWLTFISAVLTKKDTSFIPYIGAVLILLGMFLIGKNTIQSYWWLAFIIEFTTFPMLLIAPVVNTFRKNNENT